MAKSKFDWRGLLAGFKTILSRNAILIILFNLATTFGNNMKNGFRTLIGADLGLAAAAIGVAITCFSIGAILIRTPTGGVTDTRRGKLKYLLAAGGVIRIIIFTAYAFVSDPVLYRVIVFLDGVLFGFVGTMVPACLALSVDRKAMGAAYAVYMALMTSLGGIAKATGINLYNNYGQTTAGLAAAATGLLMVVVALLIDGKKWEQLPQKKGAAKKKGIFAGFSVKMLPLAICCAVCIVCQTIDQSFAPIYARDMGFDYAGAIAASGVFYGLTTFVVTALCDFINPVFFIYLTLGGLITGNVLMAVGATNTIFCVGVWIYNLSRCYNSPFKVMGMKAVSAGEQGSLQATMLLMTDIVSLFASTLGGIVAQTFGYTGAYWFSAIVVAINLVVFTIFLKRGTYNYVDHTSDDTPEGAKA